MNVFDLMENLARYQAFRDMEADNYLDRTRWLCSITESYNMQEGNYTMKDIAHMMNEGTFWDFSIDYRSADSVVRCEREINNWIQEYCDCDNGFTECTNPKEAFLELVDHIAWVGGLGKPDEGRQIA